MTFAKSTGWVSAVVVAAAGFTIACSSSGSSDGDGNAAGSSSAGSGGGSSKGGSGTSGSSAQGSAGDDSGGTSASGGSAGGTGKGGSSSCPPECFAPYECVNECGQEPFNNGCCPCPDGTIDAYQCEEPEPTDCGVTAAACPEQDCGPNAECMEGICVPNAAECASPPGGVGCATDTECLNFPDSQEGLCFTPSTIACLCNATPPAPFACD
jgi:hypothetical protein